jgi:accessory Sec system glycosylation protein GtfA
MTVYNINLGIGWASSGVEYAQAYRGKVLRKLGVNVKFIFMDMFQYENIEHMTRNIGFYDHEVIWLYQYFTDQDIAPTTYTSQMLESTFDTNKFTKEEYDDKIVYTFDDDRFYTAYRVRAHSNYIHRVEFVSSGKLIRKDYFTYTRVFTEYYAPFDHKAHLYRRCWYNKDGTIGLDEYIDDDQVVYRVGPHFFYNKEDFIGYFLDCLNFQKGDVMIIDRSTGMEGALLKHAKEAKVGVVIHAEHFNEDLMDDDNILWNNYYEYEFDHYKHVDFYIASTRLQAKTLREQFKHYYNATPRVVSIPVGSISELKYNDHRKKHAYMTASRLASEKHVDYLVDAVALAHEKIPDITFDIYGRGGEAKTIENAIRRHNASSYITMKGHQKLDEVFKNYEGYLSASGSEGFGLTLLEAVGSGLPIIGFNVTYGNTTFVKDGRNGYLIDKGEDEDKSELVKKLSEKIVMMASEESMDDFYQVSYDIAKDYLDENVEKMWAELLEDVQ